MLEFRATVTLLLIGLYLLLNWGLMLIRVPGINIPVGEVLLVIYLVWISDLKWLGSFNRSVFVLPFVIWWILGLGRAFVGFYDHGIWALRDATHIVESLFLWVGFVCAASPAFIDRLFRWLPWLLVIACIYYLGYPFRETLQEISPKVSGLAEYSAPIFFQYVNTPTLALVAAAYLLTFDTRLGRTTGSVLASMLVAYVIVMSQGRTAYLQVIVLCFLIVLYKREALKSVTGMGAAAVLIGVLIPILDIRITGRLGETFSFDFIGRHFMSIFGVTSAGVEGAASGATMRLEWWGRIWDRLTSSNLSFLFGLGYGIPLTDFRINDQIIVREPHNSFFSVLARLGLVGLVAFLWMHVNLFRAWRRAFLTSRDNGDRMGESRLLVLLIYFALVLVFCLGEDGLEKPFNAIPYYFFWGVVLHYGLHIAHRSVAASGIEPAGVSPATAGQATSAHGLGANQ